MSSFAVRRVLGAMRQGGQALHHSARALLPWAACLGLASPATAGNGYVGIYADSLGTTPCATIPQSTGATLYVIAQTDGGTASGITGAEFRIEVTNPSGWLLSYTSSAAASVVLGNPIDTDPDPDAGGGLNLAFPSCQTPTGSGQVRLGTISVYNLSGSATSLLVKRHSQPTNAVYSCPLLVKCDDPYYTTLCMTMAAQDSCILATQKRGSVVLHDPPVFTAELNSVSEGAPALPHDPDREVLALFAPGVIQLPPGQTHATLASTTVNVAAVAAVLESYEFEGVAKAFPDFEPEDAIGVAPTGQTVLLQNLSEIYRFLLAPGESPMQLVQELGDITDYVGYAELSAQAIFDACPNDQYLATHQWALRNTGLPTPEQSSCTAGADIQYCDADSLAIGGPPVTIGIIDSGVSSHQDFGSLVGDPDISLDGHGTHVAGVAAAKVGNGTGIAGVKRNAIIASKHANGIGGPAQAVRDAIDKDIFGARVLNNSYDLGTYSSEDDQFFNTVRGAFRDAYILDVVAVASMGNNGGAIVQYPAAFGQGIIAVGATDCEDKRATFSSTGPHIDVAAPGVDIWSTVAPSTYEYKSGTSSSAPQVAGLAATLRAANYSLTNDDIEQLIRLSADDVNHATLPGPDSQLGAGRINARRALEMLRSPYQLLHEVAIGGVVVDSTATYRLWFHVPPDSSPGRNFFVRRFEVRKEVTFAATLDSVIHVWGRGSGGTTIGYDDSEPNWNMGWCDTVPGTLTQGGCTLRTFVYDVKSYPDPQTQAYGWWPAHPDSVRFAYSVLGRTTPTDVRDAPAGTVASQCELLTANPLRRGGSVSLMLPRPDRVEVALFNVAGRRVRLLNIGQLHNGRHELRWDGKSDAGTPLASGLYFLRLKAGAETVLRKVVVIE